MSGGGGSVYVATSLIEGRGMFAAEPFAPGQLIRRRRELREVTEAAPLRPDDGEREDHCDERDGRLILIGYPDRHVNHSCEPTAYKREAADGAVELIALRPIARGDEITVDYAIDGSGGGTPLECHCGAARCRGTIGGFFELPPDRQRAYLPLVPAWFRCAHADAFETIERGAAPAAGETGSRSIDRRRDAT